MTAGVVGVGGAVVEAMGESFLTEDVRFQDTLMRRSLEDPEVSKVLFTETGRDFRESRLYMFERYEEGNADMQILAWMITSPCQYCLGRSYGLGWLLRISSSRRCSKSRYR